MSAGGGLGRPAGGPIAEQRRGEEFSLTAVAVGHDSNRLVSTDALAGTDLSLELGDGSILGGELGADGSAVWRERGPGGGAETSEPASYRAIEVDFDTHYVELELARRPLEAVTLIVNRATRRALAVRSVVGERKVAGEPQVSQRFDAAVLAGPVEPAGEVPAPTRDLIGRRILYDYGPDHLYEHVYMSTERYAWQCLRGVERGYGDCDLATTYRFAPGRYVFAFREFRLPVSSVFFYNLDRLRSTGRLFGLGDEGRPVFAPAGAHMRPLGQVEYPAGGEPV